MYLNQFVWHTKHLHLFGFECEYFDALYERNSWGALYVFCSVESSGNSCNKNDIKRQSRSMEEETVFLFLLFEKKNLEKNRKFSSLLRSFDTWRYMTYIFRSENELDTHFTCGGIILCCMLILSLSHVHISDLIKSSSYCYLTCFQSAHISSSSVESTTSAHNVILIQENMAFSSV